MKTVTLVKNWVKGIAPEVLKNIHQNDINVAIYHRDVSVLEKEISHLLTRDIQLDSCGNIDTILDEVSKVIEQEEHQLILKDIQNLLELFKETTSAKGFRLVLATINSNMCRKFHMDVKDLRMLCTYSGPGTLWLTEDNIDRKALEAYRDNQSIVIDDNHIQQAKTGSVLMLKGTIYPKEGTKGAVHRSPTIEESGERRLLLRIDTK